jgi:O-antigen ligase
MAATLYLTFSRGALVTLVGGLLVLLALAPTWSQLRAAAIALETSAVAVAVCAVLPGVAELRGDVRGDGALALAAIVVLMLVAAAVAAWARRVEDAGSTRLGRLPLPARSPALALGAACALILVPIGVSGGEGPSPTPRFGETTGRLTSTGSNRYEYWKVALRVAADHPLRGAGAGSFGTEWLQRRPIDDVVRDAHSLYVEALAELGIVGLLLLLTALGAIAAAAIAVQRTDPGLAAGPVAALTAFALHTGIDWDWELPALTLVAVTLAGLVLSRSPARSEG